jgi:hypothetical protein
MPRSISFVRWSGLAAMLSGTLWVIGPLTHASKPRGCIAEGCAFRLMWETGALGGILTPLSVLLLAVGAVGLAVLVRSAGRFGKVGIFIGAVGAAVLMIATLIQAIFFGGTSRSCRNLSYPAC